MSERPEATVVASQLVRVYRGLTEEVQAVRGVDLELEPVDFLVGGDDLPRFFGVHVGQGLDRVVDLPFDFAAHQNDLATEVLELL